jgi:hypothetical protein
MLGEELNGSKKNGNMFAQVLFDNWLRPSTGRSRNQG